MVQSAVGAVDFCLRVGVEAPDGPHVAAFPEIVPGHQFDEVRLQRQEVQPAIEPHPCVLRVQPVQICVHAFEEPGRDACHPGLAGDLALVGEVPVDSGFLFGV